MKAFRSFRPSRPVVFFFLVLFLIILALTYMTPMIADDYSYCFSWVDDARIRSLRQIVSSMAVHRQLTNGRVFTHGLVQFLLMFPKLLFDVLNGGAAVLLIWLLGSFCGELSSGRKILLYSCGALLLWDLMPVFGQVFLWLDGSVNYSWGCCLLLLFLRPYAFLWLRGEDSRPLWRKLLFLLLAFVAGTWSESGVPAVLFAAFCLLLFSRIRDRRINWWLILGLVFLLAGFLFLMSAPASHGRASSSFSLFVLASNAKNLLVKARPIMLPLYLLYAVSLVFARSQGIQRKPLILSVILVFSGLLSQLAYCFAAYITGRHFCFAVVITCLAELILLAELFRLDRPLLPRLVAACALVFALFLFPLGVLDIGAIYRNSLKREEIIRQALEAGEREVCLTIYHSTTPYSAPYHLIELSTTPHDWPNCSMEIYYGLDSISGVTAGESSADPP